MLLHLTLLAKIWDPRFLRGEGANIMVGRINGVATSLRIKFPKLISIHFANHRLAFAAAHAADNIPYLRNSKGLFEPYFNITKIVPFEWQGYMQFKGF